jgi:hypothetical protein
MPAFPFRVYLISPLRFFSKRVWGIFEADLEARPLWDRAQPVHMTTPIERGFAQPNERFDENDTN